MTTAACVAAVGATDSALPYLPLLLAPKRHRSTAIVVRRRRADNKNSWKSS
jgi:hypothetical protein